MDKNRRNTRRLRNGSRRVTGGDVYDDTFRGGYGGDEELSGGELFKRKISYQKRQKERRMKVKRRRTVLVMLALIVIVLILLFLTPIFNIRSVSVEGNEAVAQEQIVESMKPLIGQNLLRTSDGKIRNMLKAIPYIKDVEVHKHMFPPSVEVKVTEYTPAAVIRADGKNLVISSDLQVLEESQTKRYTLPVITGIEVNSAEIGKMAEIGGSYKDTTLKTMLRTLESTQLLNNVVEINLNSLTSITMNYNERITVQCGTQLDIERKLRLLKEALTSDALAENARGTIDLSDAGKAIYTP